MGKRAKVRSQYDAVHLINNRALIPRSGVVIRFIIGLSNAQDDVISELRAEQEVMHDLALLPDLEDRYDKLTQKLAASLSWAYQNYEFDYFLKV